MSELAATVVDVIVAGDTEVHVPVDTKTDAEIIIVGDLSKLICIVGLVSCCLVTFVSCIVGLLVLLPAMGDSASSYELQVETRVL